MNGETLRAGMRAAATWLAVFVAAVVADKSLANIDGLAPSPEAIELPFAFERNQGQANPAVRFIARRPQYDLFLLPLEAVFVLKGGPSSGEHSHAIRMTFEAAVDTAARGLQPLPYRTNYLRGDPSDFIVDVESHAKVEYPAIYPGIDLVYYGRDGALEYDFQVAAGADPNHIRIRFAGMNDLRITAAGDLVIDSPLGGFTFRRPQAFQDAGGARKLVEVAYQLAANKQIKFKLGEYDRSLPLLIDPILSYSSYFWSAPKGIAVDSNRNAYVVGQTTATDLPAATGYQPRRAGSQDAYVIKIDSTGKNVLYATYLGARRSTTTTSDIAVDAAGNALIVGTPSSASFPTTAGAWQRTYSAGSSFVAKLNASGNALLYSTFVPGTVLRSIAVDPDGSAYLTGARGTGFVTTPGAYNTSGGGCALTKLNPAGSALSYSTYFGGATESCTGVASDPAGNAYLTGTLTAADLPVTSAAQPVYGGKRDAFVAKINAAGNGLLYATYLGGTEDEYGNAIAVNSAGEAFAVGRTHSQGFPVTLGAFQTKKGDVGQGLSDTTYISNAFITKINDTGTTMLYSSFLGGAWCFDATHNSCTGPGDIDAATRVAVDSAGYAYVAGYTASVGFPLRDPVQGVSTGGDNDRAPFLAKVGPLGNRLVYSSVLGGRGADGSLSGLAVDAQGAAYAVGTNANASSSYPLTAGMPLTLTGQSYVFKFAPGRNATVVRSSRANAPSSSAVTFTAEVETAASGGSVVFRDGAATLGSAALVNGSASLSVFLQPGVHPITAEFSGDQKVSAPIYQVVIDP